MFSLSKLFMAAMLSISLCCLVSLNDASAQEGNKVASTGTSDLVTQLKAAKAAYEQGEPNLARKHLLVLVEKSPDIYEAHYLLSLIYGQESNFSLSIVHARKCIGLKSDFAPAYAVLGRSLASVNKFDEAIPALEKSCRLDSKSASNLSNLAVVLAKTGNYKKALECFKLASEIDPHYVNAYLGMSSCLGKLGDLDGQVAACRKACEMVPESALGHARLGILLSEKGDFVGSLAEGFKANVLRLKESWSEFLGTFLTAWASVFLAFAAIFAVVFAGSRFKPQQGETVVRSFFLTFYKDKPGRFVVTSDRLVFVPEAFSAWFGSTNVSIQRGQIESINYLSTVGGGTVSILTRDGSVHQFRMPLLVLDPLRSLLVSQGLVSRDPDAPTSNSASETPSPALPLETSQSQPEDDLKAKTETEPTADAIVASEAGAAEAVKDTESLEVGSSSDTDSKEAVKDTESAELRSSSESDSTEAVKDSESSAVSSSSETDAKQEKQE
ncbi:MAG: tetratricopeptide repeat protein [Candidatus Obscuribacterales bacterium]|nr:tetratricopeptide repeat protein [Candidatus Obscuribacterales bacterium]